MSYSKIELRFPSSIYYADPYSAIRSILGNDVEIISFKESNIVLPDGNILVDVEYSTIDFDLFRLYSIEETKIISQQSQKTVATKLKDTITNEIIDSSNENGKNKIVVISNVDAKNKKYIFIKYSDRAGSSTNLKNLKYYGYSPSTKSDVLHSYCSILDNDFLSYHGTLLKHTPDFKDSIIDCNSSDFNFNNEFMALQKLDAKCETNNFTNANLDLSTFFQFSDSNLKFSEIKLDDVKNGKSGIINLTGSKIDDIKKAFVGQKGIILISKYRENVNAVGFFTTNLNTLITENCIDNMLMILDYDNFNLKLTFPK